MEFKPILKANYLELSPCITIHSTQKTLQHCATTMGSKISLLVYQWPLIVCKILTQNYLRKYEDWRKKSGKLCQNLDRLVYEWVTFSLKIGICLGYIWVHFQTPGSTSLAKLNLHTPGVFSRLPKGNGFGKG